MPSKQAPTKKPSFFASIFGFGEEPKPKATKKTKKSSSNTKKSRPKQNGNNREVTREMPRELPRQPSLASLQYSPQMENQQLRHSPARSAHSLGSRSHSGISVAEPIYMGHPSPNNAPQDLQSHYSHPSQLPNDEHSYGPNHPYQFPDDMSYGPNGQYPPAYGPNQYPFPPMQPYGNEYPYPPYPYPYPYPPEPRRQKPLAMYKRAIHESLEEAAEEELRRRADEEALEQAIQMSLSEDPNDPNQQEKLHADDDAITSALIRSVYDQGPQRPYDPRIHGPLLQSRSPINNDEHVEEEENDVYNVEEENGQEEYLEEGNYDDVQNQEYEQEYDQEGDEIDDNQDLYYLQQRHSARGITKKPFRPVLNQTTSYSSRNSHSNEDEIDNESYQVRIKALTELQRPSYDPPRIEKDEYEEPEEEKADEIYERKGKYQTVSFQHSSAASNLNSVSFASYDSGSVPYISSVSADNFVVTEDGHRDLILGDD